mmetsp:Transcript_9230/g.27233  ORF Transcript_9230/g.27233 Transcript_9230/m.27233 type:complete len:222 (-) Transcript_9230:456-1121(-)
MKPSTPFRMNPPIQTAVASSQYERAAASSVAGSGTREQPSSSSCWLEAEEGSRRIAAEGESAMAIMQRKASRPVAMPPTMEMCRSRLSSALRPAAMAYETRTTIPSSRKAKISRTGAINEEIASSAERSVGSSVAWISGAMIEPCMMPAERLSIKTMNRTSIPRPSYCRNICSIGSSTSLSVTLVPALAPADRPSLSVIGRLPSVSADALAVSPRPSALTV